MYERRQRSRPKPWSDRRLLLGPTRFLLFHRIEWYLSWVAWALGAWTLLEVLENLSSFSVLVAVIFYFAGSGDRLKQKHYQAWQVINTAQGKGGSGGRIEALQELNADRISLVGVDASGAFLQGISLRNANLARCDMHASDLRDSSFAHAMLSFCDLRDANLRNADLSASKADNANLAGADLHGANLRGTIVSDSDLSDADLRETDLRDLQWKHTVALRLANIWGVRNASPEFLKFAKDHGAVSLESDQDWEVLESADQKSSESKPSDPQ
jgi:uncharacterized protein YjbI with pentapeptide repeats